MLHSLIKLSQNHQKKFFTIFFLFFITKMITILPSFCQYFLIDLMDFLGLLLTPIILILKMSTFGQISFMLNIPLWACLMHKLIFKMVVVLYKYYDTNIVDKLSYYVIMYSIASSKAVGMHYIAIVAFEKY